MNEPPRKYEQNNICLIGSEARCVPNAYVDTMVDESRPESGYLVRLTISSESHDTIIWLDRSGALNLSNALYEAAGSI